MYVHVVIRIKPLILFCNCILIFINCSHQIRMKKKVNIEVTELQYESIKF